MAEATVSGRRQNNVSGNRREIIATSVVFASNSDTWTTGLKFVECIDLCPTAGTAFGFTVSGGVLTLVSSGGLTFRGKVSGY